MFAFVLLKLLLLKNCLAKLDRFNELGYGSVHLGVFTCLFIQKLDYKV